MQPSMLAARKPRMFQLRVQINDDNHDENDEYEPDPPTLDPSGAISVRAFAVGGSGGGHGSAGSPAGSSSGERDVPFVQPRDEGVAVRRDGERVGSADGAGVRGGGGTDGRRGDGGERGRHDD